MKVKKGNKVAFVGVLKKNKEKTWSTDDSIELWVGRAEVLDFTINGKPIGKIGKGRIRRIRISRNGLKAGSKWLFKADK